MRLKPQVDPNDHICRREGGPLARRLLAVFRLLCFLCISLLHKNYTSQPKKGGLYASEPFDVF